MDWADAEKRYQVEDASDAEQLYLKKWALTMLEQAMQALAEEYRAADNEALYARMKGVLSDGQLDQPYTQVAAELGMTEGALKVAVHRLRKRFQEQVRRGIADTVAQPSEVDDELRCLMQALG